MKCSVISSSLLTWRTHFAYGRTAILVAVTALCWGCNSGETSNGVPTDRYIPSPDRAQAALEAVLADWQAGRPREMIERLEVKVYPIDNQRKAGQELDSFEILGELPFTGARCYAVRLTLGNPAADQKVRYVILGIDPLYVYRQEDFDLLNHWDHMMPAEPPAKTETTAPQSDESATVENSNQPPADRNDP
jgi:hypothetical protein